jgi:hypothetical protein
VANLRDIIDHIDSKSFRRDAARTGGGNVRVLNVRATTKKPTEAVEASGRHVAPHVRRGHWRRQRFGPGSKQIKRLRIAPVIVNAHLGEMRKQVYVLPETQG